MPEYFNSLMGSEEPSNGLLRGGPVAIPNDYSLLRPFDLRLVSQGDEVCDTRGRLVGIDAATEMLAQNGASSLRMAPISWLQGRPVYWDSEVQTSSGEVRKWDLLGDEETIGLSWPPEKPDQVVAVYIDGKLAGTCLIPWSHEITHWNIHHSEPKKG